MTTKSFLFFYTAITMIIASQCFADSGRVYNFSLSESNRTASISWVSENDKNYVVEEADSLNGVWSVASGGESMVADDFLSSATVSISPPATQCKFFRVREIDADGPKISFSVPAKDAISVPVTSTISVNLNDASGVSFDSITMYIDDVEVNASNLSWDGATLTYTPPSGSIGTNGQEVVIRVVASDALGNETEGISTIVVNQPLSVTSSSVLYIGDPGLGTYSYLTVNSARTDKNDIILTSIDNDSMTFSGATSTDLQEGLYFLSLIPTNIFYRKALSVSSLGGSNYFVATTNINASDVFSGNFSTDYQTCTIYGEDGLPITENKLRTKSAMASGDKKNLRSPTNITPTVQTLDEYIKLGSSFSENYQSDARKYGFGLDSEASCRLLSSFSVSGRLDPFDKDNDDLELFFQGELLFDFETGVSFAREIESYEKKKTISLAKVVVAVAPGLWIEFDFDGYVYLALEAAIEGRISSGAEVGCGFCFHRRKKAGTWYAYADNWTDWYANRKAISLDIDGKASARVGAGIKITAFFESLIGPFVSGGPFIEGSVSYGHNFQDNSQHLRKKVIAGGEVDAGVDTRFIKIPSLGSKTLHADIYKVLYEDEDIAYVPEISMPSEIVVTNGDSVTVSPVIEGTEPISYSWAKNGIPIGNTERVLSFTANEKNAGIYSLTALNMAGVANKSVLITVVKDLNRSVVGVWHWKDVDSSVSSSSDLTSRGEQYLHIYPDMSIREKKRVVYRYKSDGSLYQDTGWKWYNSGSASISGNYLRYIARLPNGGGHSWGFTIDSNNRGTATTSGRSFTVKKISDTP